MSESGGLRKHGNTAHRNNNKRVAPYYGCSLSPVESSPEFPVHCTGTRKLSNPISNQLITHYLFLLRRSHHPWLPKRSAARLLTVLRLSPCTRSELAYLHSLQLAYLQNSVPVSSLHKTMEDPPSENELMEPTREIRHLGVPSGPIRGKAPDECQSTPVYFTRGEFIQPEHNYGSCSFSLCSFVHCLGAVTNSTDLIDTRL